MADRTKQFADLTWPDRGLDQSTELELQPVGTAAEALNVRVCEPGTLRLRGASRPGTARWVDERPANSPVQFLGVVVRADADAVGLAAPGGGGFDPYGTEGPDWIEDPSTNNKAPPGAGDPESPNFNPDDPDVRNPGRRLPPGGGGDTPTRAGGTPPVARPNAADCEPAGGSVTIDVLANDDYLGTPTIAVSSGPLFDGATAVVTGTGADSRIVYTSRPGGETDVYEDQVGYRLFGSKNTSLSANVVRVSVRAPDDGGGGGEETFELISGVVQADGRTVKLTFGFAVTGLASGDLLAAFSNVTKGTSKFNIPNAGGETGKVATFDTGSGWVFAGDTVRVTVESVIAGVPVPPAPTPVTLTNNSGL